MRYARTVIVKIETPYRRCTTMDNNTIPPLEIYNFSASNTYCLRPWLKTDLVGLRRLTNASYVSTLFFLDADQNRSDTVAGCSSLPSDVAPFFLSACGMMDPSILLTPLQQAIPRYCSGAGHSTYHVVSTATTDLSAHQDLSAIWLQINTKAGWRNLKRIALENDKCDTYRS